MSETTPLLPIHEPKEEPKRTFNAVDKLLLFLMLGTISVTATGSASSDLQYNLICRSSGIPSEQCFTAPLAAELDSIITGYTTTMTAVLSLIAMPAVAHLRPKFGDRNLLLFGSFSNIVRHAIFLRLGFNFHGSIYWLLLPAALSCISLINITQVLGVSFICDRIKDTTGRAKYLSWISASAAISGIIGPLLASCLTKMYGLYTTYFSAVCMDVIAFIVGVYVIESFTPAAPAEDREKGSLLDCMKVMSCKYIPQGKQRTNGRWVICILIIYQVLKGSTAQILGIDVKLRFGWGTAENGLFMAVNGAVALIAFTAIYPAAYAKFSSWFTVSGDRYDIVDRITAQTIFSINVVAFAIIGAASNPREYVYGRLFQLLEYIPAPGFNTLLVKYSPPQAAGSLFAGMAVVRNLADLFLPSLFLRLYRTFMQISIPMLFYLLSSMMIGLGILTIFTLRTDKDQQPEHSFV